MSDDDPGEVARNDQACAGFREIASFHAAYFNGLLRHGLSRDEALELTTTYIYTHSSQDPPDSDR